MSWQSSLDTAIRNLRTEEQSLAHDLEKVREAIDRLSGLGSRSASGRGRSPGKKRRLSAEGRAAISKAARKRWAKWRAGQKGKTQN